MNIVKKQLSYNLIISDILQNKINQYCSSINNREWSGIVFYKYIKNEPEHFIADDMFLMDIGDSVSTEIEINMDVACFLADNDHLSDHRIGYIHSHHNMKAFFSSVDVSTLYSRGTLSENFLSLIVNNNGEYCARITSRLNVIDFIDRKTESFDFDGNKTITSNKIEKNDVIVEYNELNVIPSKSFIENKKIIDCLIEEKTKTSKATILSKNNQQYVLSYNDNKNNCNSLKLNQPYSDQVNDLSKMLIKLDFDKTSNTSLFSEISNGSILRELDSMFMYNGFNSEDYVSEVLSLLSEAKELGFDFEVINKNDIISRIKYFGFVDNKYSNILIDCINTFYSDLTII